MLAQWCHLLYYSFAGRDRFQLSNLEGSDYWLGLRFCITFTLPMGNTKIVMCGHIMRLLDLTEDTLNVMYAPHCANYGKIKLCW